MKDLLTENVIAKLLTSSRLLVVLASIYALFAAGIADKSPGLFVGAVAGLALAYVASETLLKVKGQVGDGSPSQEAVSAEKPL